MMAKDAHRFPNQGEVWWIDLEPVRGHEQGKKRPCLVVSDNAFNAIPHGLVWVVPVSSSPRRHSLTVEVTPPEGGMKVTSAVLCHQLRTVSVERMDKRAGTVSPVTMQEVMRRVVMILGAKVSAQ
jgi:mRNA interferase MazF